MKKITLTAMAVMLIITAFAQDWARKEAVVNKTATAPALNAIREPGIYTGDGYAINTWVNHGDPATTSPVAGVEAKFWFAYDDTNLYVFSEIALPTKQPNDEIVCLVAIDAEDYKFGWEASPVNENGAIFSKAVLSGTAGDWSVAPDEPGTIRQFKYIYSNTTDGYEIEFSVPWASLTTDAAIVTAFKERGTFFFDVGYKLGGVEEHFFAWSNNNNKVHEETNTAGIVTLSEFADVFQRKTAIVPHTAVAPVLNAIKDTNVYTGDGHSINTWVVHGDPATTSPVAGVDAKFWFAYDDTNLYVFSEIALPTKHASDEIVCLVALDAEDYKFGWEGSPVNDNGAIFSKAVLSGTAGDWSVAPDEPGTIRQFTYIYSNTPDGYEIEFRVPWASLTTDAALVTAFKQRGKFFFDVGYKLGGVEEHFFAWSNNNNKVHEETFTAALVTLGSPVSAGDILKQETFSVYPNPARNTLYISSEKPILVAEVYNVLGARVQTADVQSGSMDISGLKEGIYIIRVSYENGKTDVSRFVKK